MTLAPPADPPAVTAEPTGPDSQLMRVRSDSSTSALAGSIAHQVRRQGWAELSAVGAGAVNQAVKATAAAAVLLAPEGMEVAIWPRFADIEIEGQSRTAIRLLVAPSSRVSLPPRR